MSSPILQNTCDCKTQEDNNKSNIPLIIETPAISQPTIEPMKPIIENGGNFLGLGKHSIIIGLLLILFLKD